MKNYGLFNSFFLKTNKIKNLIKIHQTGNQGGFLVEWGSMGYKGKGHVRFDLVKT